MITALLMIFIFIQSALPADLSQQESGVIVFMLSRFLSVDPEGLSFVIRKCAHFTEYMILGILLRFCLESWFGKHGFLSPAGWAGGTLYACTDEMHQILSDGRSALWTDVLIDSTGTLCGVLLVQLVLSHHQSNGRATGNRPLPAGKLPLRRYGTP